METNKKTRDKREILLVVPLMFMPFMALAFYAMGGGSGVKINAALASKGINTTLPDASFKADEPVDKMGFYAKAGKDTSIDTNGTSIADKLGNLGDADLKTMEINSKLAALNREINAPVVGAPETKVKRGLEAGASTMKSDVDRLELLMKSMQDEKQRDPEMDQMNNVLDKILDIQNPARAQQKVLGKIYSGQHSEKFSAITALVDGSQNVVQGGSVKLKLTDSILLSGIVIPKGHLLFGLCRIVNQRLLLDIKNIRLGNQIIPVDLSVYSLDGMPGIDAPDAVFRDVAGSGAEDAIGGVQIYGLDGIGGQVAGAGIDAARSLLSKKVRVVKVRLKGDFPVLLRVNKEL
ncbi:conjugative transposon protein TraM [Pedobacter lithocola]|uniref:Conjugative transposon protein TraM n=1 Tax=Pedobacter lithocola TaxID=1908239 RepID=A0ABV8PGA2_9SPHI